jgi:hypothetical protein
MIQHAFDRVLRVTVPHKRWGLHMIQRSLDGVPRVTCHTKVSTFCRPAWTTRSCVVQHSQGLHNLHKTSGVMRGSNSYQDGLPKAEAPHSIGFLVFYQNPCRFSCLQSKPYRLSCHLSKPYWFSYLLSKPYTRFMDIQAVCACIS